MNTQFKNGIPNHIQPSRRWPWFVIRIVVGLLLLLGIPLSGQSSFPQFPVPDSGRNGRNSRDPDDLTGQDRTQQHKRIRMMNDARQKLIVSDTEKLLQLAKELNDAISASDSATMTPDQLRKVNEIARLAHNIREKMIFSVGGYPRETPPFMVGPPMQ